MAAENAFYSKLEKPQAEFLASIGKTSMTVFPAAVRRSTITYDDHAPVTLAEFLNTNGLADATTSDRHVPITTPWRMNQARMWLDSAKEFGAFVRANPIATRCFPNIWKARRRCVVFMRILWTPKARSRCMFC
jgi:hypothetical protein